jgi:hypothetical protein
VANYATLNPLDFQNANTYSNANLNVSLQAATASLAFSGFGVSSGKWYWEVNPSAGANYMIGIATQAGTLSLRNWTGANSIYYYTTGDKYVSGTASAYGASYTLSDTIGVALDLNANTITFYKNNTSQGSISIPSGLQGQIIVSALGSGTGSTVQTYSINFGQRPFAYTPPTGYVALNTFNLLDSTIKKGNTVMDATTYTGTGASLSVTNAGAFKPDLVWIKSRSAATDNKLTDFVRGATKALISNTTAAETTDTTGLTAFNSNGFTLGASTTYNNTAATYVAWQWAGTGATVSNTSGTITSTVDANTTAGFSIVSYTGTGANATVGHGLGVAPKMVITKNRGATSDWAVWHISLTSGAYYLLLDTTAAQASGTTYWNSTIPTSSVFSVGTATPTNVSTNTYVAYCWAEIAGFSKAFSYTGNGSTDGPFVYLGFRPKFIMLKNSSAAGGWVILDTSRNTYNVAGNELYPNSSAAEGTGYTDADFLSNGFKLRIATDPNASSGAYIGMAWAENPFKNSLAR